MEVNKVLLTGYLNSDPMYFVAKDGQQYAYAWIRTTDYYHIDKKKVIHVSIPLRFANYGAVKRADWAMQQRQGDYVTIEGHLTMLDMTNKPLRPDGTVDRKMDIIVERMSFPQLQQRGKVVIEEDQNFMGG